MTGFVDLLDKPGFFMQQLVASDRNLPGSGIRCGEKERVRRQEESDPD
jgi:hypothetical protein